MDDDAIEELEIGLLLQALRQAYGIDFGDYADASLGRRLRHWLAASGFATFSQAQERVLRDRQQLDSLVQGITVNVTEMFRDPAFFLALRENVIPFLKTYPFINIWHAGCASGEEAYSMAILLHEAGLGGRYRMLATDINQAVLARAREGIFPLKSMQLFTRNYQRGGGSASFADYYTARYERAIMMAPLRENLVFAHHDLVTDGEMAGMNLILCRNVMIYFKTVLRERCLDRFDASLLPGGFLCLGTKERLGGSRIAPRYDELAARLSIYRKHYAQP
jgi:chemotaxis protein methyltransferase CheR